MNSNADELNRAITFRSAVLRSVLVSILLFVGGFAAGIAVERKLADEPTNQFADLEAVHQIIDDNYYYQPTSDEGKAEMNADMEAGAIEGAIGTLDDSYTRYLDVDESKTADEGLEGRYGGVGLDLVVDEGIAFVVGIVPGSPADRAGIVRGDVIEQVDGELVFGLEQNDIVRLLRGEIGTQTNLTIVRPGTGEVDVHTLTMEEIVIPPVTLVYLENGTIAWLRVSIFGDSTVADLDRAIADIRASGATGVILDLRGNGGGWVEAALQTLGRFLDPGVGPAMYEDTTPGEGGMTPMEIMSSEGVTPLDLPLVVLIDGGTASAAEIVAGALKDYNRALVIGQTTFGKGSVQRIFQFSDGATMRVTVAEWFTPSRGRIQNEGIRPDLEVLPSGHGADQDPVLDAGVLALQNQIDKTGTPSPLPQATPANGS